ncbi:MAG: Arginyl-tRNA--protein transferase 1 [Vezdaea acicularis]|nr:MAG: Arginyl-tRNA--protein transferase 1 [Vezdaea acicularis]
MAEVRARRDLPQRIGEASPEKQTAKRKNHFDLSESVHDCEYPNIPTPPEPEHGFEVKLEPDTFSESKFRLYENYQRLVHKEPPSRITRAGFRDFLCDSPLTRSTQTLANGKEKKLGSYHQCYYLDDRLVAIGVLDLLPHCVSGVYFIYHDDLSKWQFGKLGALREACFAGESDYRYYYMGYYIHSCVKMRYKASYAPQNVLDPETYDWDPLEPEYTHRLDRRRYVSLSRERKGARNLSVEENIEGDKGRNVESKAVTGLPRETTTSDEALSDLEGAQDVTTNKIEDRDDEEELDADEGGDLFTSGMPGILMPSEVLQQCNLDNTPIFVKPHLVTADCLVSWETSGGIDKVGSIKHIFAEFAACIGTKLANDPSFVKNLLGKDYYQTFDDR